MIGKYYDNVYDCPMMAFKSAMKGSYKGMFISGIYLKRKAINAYKKVFNEADEKFGIADNYRQYLSKMVKAADFYSKAVSGQKHYFTRAKVLEKEAEALLGGSDESLEKVCAMLTKKMGVKVSSKEVTVSEYYTYIELKE